MSSKTDYRTVLSKSDIVTMRRALREAIFLYSAEGAPESAKKRLGEFKSLLKKIGGQPIQRLMDFPEILSREELIGIGKGLRDAELGLSRPLSEIRAELAAGPRVDSQELG